MKALGVEKRAPRMIVLENVRGALTSHAGRDFAAIGAALTNAGYRFGAILIDAVHFLPQSRPRLFVVAIDKSTTVPDQLVAAQIVEKWHPPAVVAAYGKLSSLIERRPGFGGGSRRRRRGTRRSPIYWRTIRRGFVGTRKLKPIGCSE